MQRDFLTATKGGLIVSCQALEGEPLHSSCIMSRMAYAAVSGGACGIRANSTEDIREIQKAVSVPMIGIIKKDYPDSEVYITPTVDEVDALMKTGVDVISMDATNRVRPGGRTLTDFFTEVRRKYPNQLFMADCATYEEGCFAEKLGFDIVSTTLSGYTSETRGNILPDIALVKRFCQNLKIPVIAEGGIWSPEALAGIFGIRGLHAAVVGSAITRPQEITRRFVQALNHGGQDENTDN
mgnify:FL=1